ncbi:MAG: hypothetical protein LBD86_04650, partial [Spirochaetaceae bacterium]|nr:hypothetical protein [Spirochaetaceae bacterium]
MEREGLQAVDVDFVLEATKPAEGTGSDSRINFMLADFNDTFKDFNTGSSAVRSVPDVDDIQLSAVSINLSQVAISCETWNG